MPDSIAFVWENFGPTHADRCEATARHFAGTRLVLGIELAGMSSIYDWQPETRAEFQKITLFPGTTIDKVGVVARTLRTVQACLSARDIFFCHYENPATFFSACLLRLSGRRVYVMNDSKFDDKARILWRERWKRWLHLPYRGGLAAGRRATDYMRLNGVPETRICEGYDNIDFARIRRLAKEPPAPAGVSFADRHFTVVARFVPKKNLLTALLAFATYRGSSSKPRRLVIVGSGPLEPEIRTKITELGLEAFVELTGFQQTERVCEILATSLVLLMPSVEEQFGIAALEAIAMGVPVIV